MINTFIKAIVILVIPIVVFLAGAWVMWEVSDYHLVGQALSSSQAEDRQPLNSRFGYGVDEVDRHWGPVVSDDAALKAERRFLQFDLVFPFLYGAALATSLLMAWVFLGRPFNTVWLVAPVAITLVADWTENLVQLGQLRLYAEGGGAALQNGCIQLASSATITKLLFFSGTALFVVALVVVMLVRAIRQGLMPRPNS